METAQAEQLWKDNPHSIIRDRLRVLRARGQEHVTSNELAKWLYQDFGVKSMGMNGGAKTIGKMLSDLGLAKYGIKKYVL